MSEISKAHGAGAVTERLRQALVSARTWVAGTTGQDANRDAALALVDAALHPEEAAGQGEAKPVVELAWPPGVQGMKRALATFTEYFVKNYPGPDTIIHDPKWHAPKIFAAAKYALATSFATPTEEATALAATPRPEAPVAPDIVERARAEARQLAERAGIDMLDDHDEFITDMTDTIARFTAEALAALSSELAAAEREIDRLHDENHIVSSNLEAAEAKVARLKDENTTLKEALVAHNDLLRGAFGAAQRDAIHEVIGTTNYNLLANAIQKVLFKYYAITNDARSLTATKGG